MQTRLQMFALPLSIALLCGVASAQDSTSANADGGNGLPGDGITPWGMAVSQRANYVVDLATLRSSWGNTFGGAPLMKAPRVNTGRFNAVSGPSSFSPDTRNAQPFLATSYSAWNVPTAGIAPGNNTALATSVTPPASGTRFAISMLDFDEQPVGATFAFFNTLTTGIVGFDPATPDRLYVSRINAALNSPNGGGDRSQFGLGSVDADGNTIIRADSFGASGASSLLQGNNYIRIRSATRGTGANVIDSSGFGDVANTNRVVENSSVLLTAPAALPASTGSSRIVGADFVGNLLIENTGGGTTQTSAHRPSTLDHRASPSITSTTLWPSTIATGIMLTRGSAGGGLVNAMSVFGFDANGAVTNARTVELPTAIIDPCDSFAWPVTNADFRLYDTQAIFRGGVGPAAVGKNLQGQAVVASTAYASSSSSSASPINAIVAARFDPSSPTSNVTWGAVAWVNATGTDGKDILGDFGADGAPNTNDAGENDGAINATDAPVGRIESLTNLPGGLTGPSLSAPALDSAGNIYFIASVSLRKLAGSLVQDTPTIALLRGVPTATGCYQLEVLLEAGQLVQGRNSGRTYRIANLSLSDGDSLASSSFWSQSVSSTSWSNVATSNLPQSAPQHLGGLVVSARVLYDADNNGTFSDPTAIDGNPASADEAYSVAYYVGNILPAGGCNDIDFNNDGLFPDDNDVIAFLNVLAGGPCPTPSCDSIDFNNDGLFPDDNDLISLLNKLAGQDC
jgi:hypothetical protein